MPASLIWTRLAQRRGWRRPSSVLSHLLLALRARASRLSAPAGSRGWPCGDLAVAVMPRSAANTLAMVLNRCGEGRQPSGMFPAWKDFLPFHRYV